MGRSFVRLKTRDTADGRQSTGAPPGVFYGWWIVAASFLNLFFSVGIIYYGFPVFYPAFISCLGFTHAQVTQGFLLGFLIVGIPAGILAGILVDRIGARVVIACGIGFVGVPLVLMGLMTRLWQFEALCMVEVLGYALAGPIANQVLISQWFRKRRGQAMGYAYLGLGLGGAVAPWLANTLIHAYGWRHALQITGAAIMIVLFPVGLLVTCSTPRDKGLTPDGLDYAEREPNAEEERSVSVAAAARTLNFWLILVGTTLVIGAVNAVIQHCILYLRNLGYTPSAAAHVLSIVLVVSLAGRVLVGHLADRFQKKNTMALFYLLLGVSIPLLLFAGHPAVAWSFAVAFGFVLGADYMLIPLVTAECFGTAALGKLLALIIMGYTVGQWIAPWVTGKIFDTYHSYELAWKIMAAVAVLGAIAIYGISVPRGRRPAAGVQYGES